MINPTASTSILTATKTIPANSIQVGDQFVYEITGRYGNSQNNSIIQVALFYNATISSQYTTPAAVNLDATTREPQTVPVAGCGSVDRDGVPGVFNITDQVFMITPSAAGATPLDVAGFGGGANGYVAVGAEIHVIDTTADMVTDVQCKVTTSSSLSQFKCVGFSIQQFA